jgi:hypothetical protein
MFAAKLGPLARNLSDEAAVKELAALYEVGLQAMEFHLTNLVLWTPLYDVVPDAGVPT